MKVCQVAPYFPYKEHLATSLVEKGYHIGGVERHVYNLSRELSKLGLEVTVISSMSPKHSSLTEVKGIDVVRLPINFRIASSPIEFNALKLNLDSFDVIHAHTPVPFLADFIALNLLRKKKPLALTYHNDISKDGLIAGIAAKTYNFTFGKTLLKTSDAIVATTNSYASKSKQLKPYSQKLHVIPNGVDIEKFASNSSQKTGAKNEKTVLFVGRLDTYKGCEYLIRAFSCVQSKVANVRLVIVGKGPLEADLKRLVMETGLAEKVVFTGNVQETTLIDYYNSCDVFVLPSISANEGFGMVQIEAMACQKPVITTTLSGVSEVDKDCVASIHVPPRNAAALAQAIIAVLTDSQKASEMGQNGRRLVENRYTWQKVACQTLDLYKELLD